MYNFIRRVTSSLALSLSIFVIALSVSTTANASSYYLAPANAGGSDHNTGLSFSSPWLTPSHSLGCGDTITALASSSYDSQNFNSGKWGTVSCPSGNNVAWLQCQTFDACKIYSTNEGIYVDHSYWGVQGWEVSVSSGSTGFCFAASPSYASPTVVHHIIFANNVANGCMAGGVQTFNVGSNAGADYLAFLGNIVYNSAQASLNCNSGISVFQPVQSDSAAGTHILIAGNFVYHTMTPSYCAGAPAIGGQGIDLDTLDGRQGMSHPYTAQVVVDNNISIGNGGSGLVVENNNAGAQQATVYLLHNTVWGNESNTAQASNGLCSEVALNSVDNVQEAYNLVSTISTKACAAASNVERAMQYYIVNGTDWVYSNFAYAPNNQTTYAYNFGTFGFATNNTMGQAPGFVSAAVPGAPVCSGKGTTANCMASVVSNFVATNNKAAGTGYQQPANEVLNYALFPKWLCTVNLPSGLIKKGC